MSVGTQPRVHGVGQLACVKPASFMALVRLLFSSTFSTVAT
ncbi:hypothetical protein OG241_13670 [Streptomyces sp. NBC_01390]